MDVFINWLNMNGYATWVWSAYALWVVGFAWLVLGTWMGRKQMLQQLATRRRRAQLNAEQSTTHSDHGVAS